MTEKINLRIEMPVTTAWIDQMRELYGKDSIVPSIKQGMAGGTDFYACENGYEIGRRVEGKGISALQCQDTRNDPANSAASIKSARRGK